MHMWPDGLRILWVTTWWVIAFGLVASLIWFLLNTPQNPSESRESAKEILRRRYAAGEIETEEYERRLSELTKTKGAA